MNFTAHGWSAERYDNKSLLVNLWLWALSNKLIFQSWTGVVDCRRSHDECKVRACFCEDCLHFGLIQWLREITPMSTASDRCVVENLTCLWTSFQSAIGIRPGENDTMLTLSVTKVMNKQYSKSVKNTLFITVQKIKDYLTFDTT